MIQEQQPRFKYASRYDLRFIFVCLVLNYSAIFHMPCGVYRHGSAFVAAYIVLNMLLAYPLIFLEAQFGQYHSRGPCNAFRICPFFEGLGLSLVILCMWLSMYYVFLIAHGIHLMAEMFYTPDNVTTFAAIQSSTLNQSCVIDMCNSYLLSRRAYYSSKSRNSEVSQSPIRLLWNFSFSLCLLVTWLIIYIVTSKQLIRQRFFVRFSCLSPLVILTFVMVLYIVKPGFRDMFIYVKYDDWKQFSSVELWVTALQQMLLSTGIGTGIIVTFASFNDFHSNRTRGDVCFLNTFAFFINVLIGMLFVEYSGTLNYDKSSNATILIPKTPGEVQLLYFNMMYYLPIPQIWMSAINVFFIISGAVSVQLCMEVLLITLQDNVWLSEWRNRFLHTISCGVLFLISLLLCIDMRYFYVANAVDAAIRTSLMYLEALLLLVLLVIYGANNILVDIRFMFKEQQRGVLVYLKYSWIASLILISALIVLKWAFLFRGYIGEIMIIFLIFLPLIIFAIYNSFRYWMRKKSRFLFKPVLSAGPQNESYFQLRMSFLMSDSL